MSAIAYTANGQESAQELENERSENVIKSSEVAENSITHTPRTVPNVPNVPNVPRIEQTTNAYPESVPSVPTVPMSTESNHYSSNENVTTIPESVQDQDNYIDSDNENQDDPPQNVSDCKPIISIEDFFSSDMPLSGHSIEESPCYPIIGFRPGEISIDTVYYCKLHPDLGSTFLAAIELHCRQKEPDIHKAEILTRIAKRDATQSESV